MLDAMRQPRLANRVLWVGLLCLLVAGVFLSTPVQAGRSGESRWSGDGRTAQEREAIIIDHSCTDLNEIPSEWIERAKELTLHYAHTSHGSQLNSGFEKLAQVDPTYAVAVKRGGSPALPEAVDSLRVYDGNDGETYITPELYWSAADGLRRTRTVASTGLFGFSMWSWCGQQSGNSVETVQQYLNVLDQLESEYPDMRFIYMTGHTDGGGDTLARNNQMVRDFALANGKALFDFADIESWDPAGNHYPDTDDACSWCSQWCEDHPEDCTDLPGSCAHSHPLNCRQKGRAFWWMMARLAGWSGTADEPIFMTYLPANYMNHIAVSE